MRHLSDTACGAVVRAALARCLPAAALAAGPPETKAIETHHCSVSPAFASGAGGAGADPGAGSAKIVVDVRQFTPDVPFGDYFYILQRYEVRPHTHAHTRTHTRTQR